jgi:hypothetical protein
MVIATNQTFARAKHRHVHSQFCTSRRTAPSQLETVESDDLRATAKSGFQQTKQINLLQTRPKPLRTHTTHHRRISLQHFQRQMPNRHKIRSCIPSPNSRIILIKLHVQHPMQTILLGHKTAPCSPCGHHSRRDSGDLRGWGSVDRLAREPGRGVLKMKASIDAIQTSHHQWYRMPVRCLSPQRKDRGGLHLSM